MTVLEFIILILVAALLGVFAQRLLGYKLGGFLVSTLLGFGGAFLGKEMALWFGLPDVIHVVISGRSFPVVWAIFGALVVTFVIGMIARGASKHQKKRTA